MDTVKNFIGKVDYQVSRVLLNPYIMAAVKTLLVLYASQYAPRLPHSVTAMFKNTIVQIVCIALIVYLSNKDLQIALLFAFVFVIGVSLVNGPKAQSKEGFAAFSDTYTVDFTGKVLDVPSILEVSSKCESVTMDQLLALFDGDQEKIQHALNTALTNIANSNLKTDTKTQLVSLAHRLGVPYNVDFSKGDAIAPRIATILMYYGVSVTDTCAPDAAVV